MNDKNEQIKVIHTFSDGTVKKSVEGLIIPVEISEKIANILNRGKTIA